MKAGTFSVRGTALTTHPRRYLLAKRRKSSSSSATIELVAAWIALAPSAAEELPVDAP